MIATDEQAMLLQARAADAIEALGLEADARKLRAAQSMIELLPLVTTTWGRVADGNTIARNCGGVRNPEPIYRAMSACQEVVGIGTGRRAAS